MYAMPPARQRRKDSAALVGVPSTVPHVVTSPATAAQVARNPCGAHGKAAAKPSLRGTHMGLAESHHMGTEFIQQVLTESQKVLLAHTKARTNLIKPERGPEAGWLRPCGNLGCTM